MKVTENTLLRTTSIVTSRSESEGHTFQQLNSQWANQIIHYFIRLKMETLSRSGSILNDCLLLIPITVLSIF
jgi:hypothetical protein